MSLPLIYCALDTKDLGYAKEFSELLTTAGCGVKLGLEFFNTHGPQGVQTILENRIKPSVFLDLKYHDIPNTVAGAVESAASLDVSYLNVHAAGGSEMMRAAKGACPNRTALLGVTVLTSSNDSTLEEVGQRGPAGEQVLRLARLTHGSGAGRCCLLRTRDQNITKRSSQKLRFDGAWDPARWVRRRGPEAHNDPRQAVEEGATHLVIGRPITQAKNPEAAVRDILASVTL